MVAADAQELVADDPDIPLIELVTRSRNEMKQQYESTSGGGPSCLGRFVRLRGKH